MSENNSRLPAYVPFGIARDDVEVFTNGEFTIHLVPNGTGSFLVDAREVARYLGFRDTARLVESIPAGEKGYTTACTPSGEQRVWHLTETGFYRASGRRQPARVKNLAARAAVERYQDWVFGDVLPEIRAKGYYGEAPPAVELPGDYESALEHLLVRVRENKALVQENTGLRGELEVAAPKVAFADEFLTADGDYLVGDVAKMLRRSYPDLDTGERKLFEQMHEWEWVFRRGAVRPGRKPPPWKADQSIVNRGWLVEAATTYTKRGIVLLGTPQVRVLPAGLAELHRRYGKPTQLALAVGGESDG